MSMNQNDEDLSFLNDFQEILQSEVFVDLERLRILANHGVPDQLRGDVWKYLLGVQQADRSKELSSSKSRSEEYEQMDKEDHETAKRIRGEAARQLKFLDPNKQKEQHVQAFVNIILAYLNTNRNIEYNASLVSLCAPFVYVLDTECDAYYCFEKLMQTMEEYNSVFSIKEQVAHYMTLFRCSLPELCNYFEDEEVNLNEWSASWLQNLLAKEMRFENLVRLWDSYFSLADPFVFHPFVCLSILSSAKETLEDLDQSEIKTMLLRLPLLEMKKIITDAYNFQNEALERQMNENGEL